MQNHVLKCLSSAFLFVVAVILIAVSTSPNAATISSTNAVRKAPQLRFQSAQQCKQCHQQIFAEWSQSWMARASVNPVFQQDYSRWQTFARKHGDDASSCLRCHAPAAVLTADSAAEAVAEEGVTCTVCHKVALVRQREGRHYLVMDPRQNILYAANTSKSASSSLKHKILSDKMPHLIRTSQALADSSLCAGCHLDVLADGTPLEHTWHEWKNSVYAENGMQCMDCHMPEVKDEQGQKTHRSHRFAGGHTSSDLLKAVAVIELLPASSATELKVKVLNQRAGHNFPTGGAHPARLILNMRIVSADKSLLHSDKRVYAFIFEDEQGDPVTGRQQVVSWQDNTLKPLQPQLETFSLPELPKNAIIHLTLVYQLIPDEMAEQLPEAYFKQHYQPVIIDDLKLKVADLF